MIKERRDENDIIIGAGNIQKTISEEDKKTYLDALEEALQIGEDVLKSGRSSVECVECVVRYLEDFPLFNAGYDERGEGRGTRSI